MLTEFILNIKIFESLWSSFWMTCFLFFSFFFTRIDNILKKYIYVSLEPGTKKYRVAQVTKFFTVAINILGVVSKKHVS